MPLDLRDLIQAGTRYTEERDRSVRIAVLVELDAADALVDAVRDALRPLTAQAGLRISIPEPGHTYAVAADTDVVVALVGTGARDLSDALRSVRVMRVPLVALSLGESHDAPSLATTIDQPLGDTIVEPGPEKGIERLGAWLCDHLSAKRMALAHNFPFMRRAVADEIVKTTSLQNAVVGAVAIVPGADMPVMTANQAKMLLQIAAAYGQPLGIERVKELAALVGGGFLFRALARQALAAVPVLGWAVKGGIGYTGTYAMGQTVIGYFEEGADLGRVTSRLRQLADSASRRLPRRRSQVSTRKRSAIGAVTVSADATLPSSGSSPVVWASGMSQALAEGAREALALPPEGV